MQYESKTPDEYLIKLENDWRKSKLVEVRELIKKHGPDLVEDIEYKMLSFGTRKNNIFHLNAQKAYVSLYVGNISKIENSAKLLDGIDTGKGCLRIKKSTHIAKTGLEEFIEKTIDFWEKGGNTEC